MVKVLKEKVQALHYVIAEAYCPFAVLAGEPTKAQRCAWHLFDRHLFDHILTTGLNPTQVVRL